MYVHDAFFKCGSEFMDNRQSKHFKMSMRVGELSVASRSFEHSWVFGVLSTTPPSPRYLALFSMLSAVLTARHATGSWMPFWLIGALLALDSALAVR